MEKIGNQKIWSYFDGDPSLRSASNAKIRAGSGHRVKSYFELARKVAELQYLNRDHVLLFRGQHKDYRTAGRSSLLKSSLFRLSGPRTSRMRVLSERFETLERAENGLIKCYSKESLLGLDRLKRHRVLRWAILQHYEVCETPLLDVTQSLRIAATFASLKNQTDEAFLFVLGVPNLSGAITASSEASLQIVRLSSACPPEAVRPHLQEGYLLGEYPEIANYEQNAEYRYFEMDFARRLVAKFYFNPTQFWSSNFLAAPEEALIPKERRDRMLPLAEKLKSMLHCSMA